MKLHQSKHACLYPLESDNVYVYTKHKVVVIFLIFTKNPKYSHFVGGLVEEANETRQTLGAYDIYIYI